MGIETASGKSVLSYISAVDVLSLEGLLLPENKDLVVVPQYVADWISYCKFKSISLLRALRLDEFDLFNYDKQAEVDEIKSFLGNEKNIELLAHAWVAGYEVEKEPLYWVRNKYGKALLQSVDGTIGPSQGVNPGFQEGYKENYMFTEREIKHYDERYWAFRVEVEE